MWVIIVDTEISSKRDNRISEIFDTLPAYSINYLMKSVKKYSQTSYIQNALIFKTESGANKIVDDFNSKTFEERRSYNSKYSWISNYYLSVKKLTPTEWNNYIDTKINYVNMKYQRTISKIEKKRKLYK